MIDLSPRSFIVRIVGEISGEEYAGTFKAKPLLSHAEQIQVDALIRDFLGPRPAEATNRAKNQAALLAETAVRLIEPTPSWWKDSRGGADLIDDSLLREVYNGALKVESDFKAEIQERAKAAKEEISKLDVK
jgi:hypothetical protein